MVALIVRAVVETGQDGLDTGISDLALLHLPGGVFAYAVTRQGLAAYSLDAGAQARLVDTSYFLGAVPGAVSGTLIPHQVNGQTRLWLGGDGRDLGAGYAPADGGGIGPTIWWGLSQPDGVASAYAALNDAAGQRMFAADADTGAITAYHWQDDGFVPGATVAGVGAGVTAMVPLLRDGQGWLFTAATGTDAIASWQIDSQGETLHQADTLGAADGLGIRAPSALNVVEAYGETHLVVAAAGSSTLSVMRVGAGGELTPTDHVLDSLHSRFADVQALETVTVDGRAYVLAGGSDDGVSLFVLLPGGRLLHLTSLADSLDTGLENITAIGASQVSAAVQVLVAGEGAAGLTQLVFSVADQGAVLLGGGGADALTGTAKDDILIGGAADDVLAGGAGADILEDGAGQDRLTGGTGADIFALRADAMPDKITDFVPGVDQIDLSDYPMLYDARELGYLATALGAVVAWRDEILEIERADGQTLSWAELMAAIRLGPDRPPMGLGSELTGTEAADALTGGWMADLIRGLGGDDTLRGNAGDDTILGGVGNDLIIGGADNDQLEGGLGNDRLYGGDGRDRLLGGDGDDQIYGEAGDDLAYGGLGTDQMFGGPGNDVLYGEAGDDQIEGGTGDDMLYGGPGADVLQGLDGADTLYGVDGNDRLLGGAGPDRLYGGVGDDTVFGGPGNDYIEGGPGNDVLHGEDGEDTIFGGSGTDIIYGGANADRIDGGDDDDQVWGGLGRDTVYLGAGNDVFFDHAQNDLNGGDRIYGGAGMDTIHLWGGDDIATGGPDADRFVILADSAADHITDFTPGEDVLAFDLPDFSYLDLEISALEGDTLLRWDSGQLTLDAVEPERLSLSDFVFL